MKQRALLTPEHEIVRTVVCKGPFAVLDERPLWYCVDKLHSSEFIGPAFAEWA
jgi:hypothetical protein